MLPGGERRDVPEEDLQSFVGPERGGAIVVGAKPRTRRADADVPFAPPSGLAAQVVEAVVNVAEARLPLWHLAPLNPLMARARGARSSRE